MNNNEPTKLELTAIHLLENGPDGISALSGLAKFHDLNVRNSVSDLRKLGVCISDEYFRHNHTGGGSVSMKRYWVIDRTAARKLVELINQKRKQRSAQSLTRDEVTRYLAKFPAQQALTPPAA